MMTTPKQNDELLEGYLDGYADKRKDFPTSLSNRSEIYKHGWENGRDDRLGRPRLPADTLRKSLQDITQKDMLIF